MYLPVIVHEISDRHHKPCGKTRTPSESNIHNVGVVFRLKVGTPLDHHPLSQKCPHTILSTPKTDVWWWEPSCTTWDRNRNNPHPKTRDVNRTTPPTNVASIFCLPPAAHPPLNTLPTSKEYFSTQFDNYFDWSLSIFIIHIFTCMYACRMY